MPLIYHPEAEAELIEAARFYERRVPGLGFRFRHEFDLGIKNILATPDRWRLLQGGIHRFIIPRFPYSIIYRIEGETIRILAVKHHSRHPDYWKSRVSDAGGGGGNSVKFEI